MAKAPTFPLNPLDVHIGARVRAKRVALGISEAVLASRLATSVQQVRQYEKGIVRIEAATLYVIARTLDVPVIYFFEALANLANDNAPGVEGEPPSPEESALFLRVYGAIKNPDLRRTLLDVAKSFAEWQRDA